MNKVNYQSAPQLVTLTTLYCHDALALRDGDGNDTTA